jgi:CubicO group peptidase (beta-lactamase class C family)
MRVSLFGVLLLGACFHTTVQAGDVDAFIKTEMERHAIPGLALAIVQEGLPVKTSAYGVANLELQVPVRAETVFEIGSITKQFTSACILLLEQEGKLSLASRSTCPMRRRPGATSPCGTCSRTRRGSRPTPGRRVSN